MDKLIVSNAPHIHTSDSSRRVMLDVVIALLPATVAAVVTGADGKIVSCRLDVAQSKMNVADGAVDTAQSFKTKMELGSDHGMAGNPYSSDNNGDGKVLEWNEQSAAFSNYAAGKTADEVANNAR